MAMALGSFVVAVALLLYGLRGRRLGDEPRCRRCGFDLRGMPTASTRCAECGSDLRGKRSLVVGTCRRRWLPIAISFAVVTISIACLVASVRGIDWRSRVPIWYATREAVGTLPGDRGAAVTQLFARVRSDDLSDADRRSLSNVLLRVQREAKVKWDHAWGDWLLKQAETDEVSRDRILTQMLSIATAFKFREIVVEGEPVRFSLKSSPLPWAGGYSMLAVDAFWEDVTWTIDGASAMPSSRGQIIPGFEISDIGFWSDTQPDAALTTLAPGPHELRMRYALRISPSVNDRRPITSVTLEHSQSILVVPKGTPPIELVDDASLEPNLRAALKIVPTRLPVGGPGSIGFLISCDGPALPIDVAFRVSVRQGSRTWDVGRLMWTRAMDLEHPVFAIAPAPAAGTVDVVLTPEPAVAERSVEATRIYGRELVFRDVPVGTPDTEPPLPIVYDAPVD